MTYFLPIKNLGTCLEQYLSTIRNSVMIFEEEKKPEDAKEKVWENPADPKQVTDERDKEQLLRQYKEAKRRHDNLSEENDNETKTEQ